FSGGVRRLNRVVGSIRRDRPGGTAVAALDEPRTVLRHHKVQITLLGAFQSAAAKYETVIVDVATRSHERKRALERISAGCRVRGIPVDCRLRIGSVKTRSRGDEFDGTGSVWIGRFG